MTLSLEQHRQEFPGLANKVYFNFGGQGTMPRAALEAIMDSYKYIQKKGPFSLKVNSWIQEKVKASKEAIASELGVAAENIALTENVTAGCNIALWGIEWQQGDHILMTDCEHPGVIAIVKEISHRFGVEISTCPIMATLNQGDPVAVIREHLQPQTKLVILSHILWNTGQVLPLSKIVEICHASNIKVLVDAAQSVGILPLNLIESKVDFYAFTGHKWLCGPEGVGGLYVSPQVLEQLHPTFIGWRGININSTGEPIGWKDDGERFEVATSAYPLYEGLSGAIATHQQWGPPEERYQKICQLSKYLWQRLSQVPGIECLKTSPPQAGLVSFQVKDSLSPLQLVEALEQQGFLLRKLANPSCVRACVHYFTLPEEIEQLVEAINKLVA